ncbi:hypothetical protein, partial [Halococcus hamelinensis]|uniref:hypothetical protein n=1 Tax=Halococcus hamelinensis TaxID=332168 RepID=UPI001ED91DA8
TEYIFMQRTGLDGANQLQYKQTDCFQTQYRIVSGNCINGYKILNLHKHNTHTLFIPAVSKTGRA